MDENKRVLESLERLSVSLKELNDISSDHELSHWRELPEDVSTAYQMMAEGAALVKATSTKYTLVGKIDFEEGSKLAQDLLKGCQLLSTGAVVLCNDDTGCARTTRAYAKQAARAVVVTVQHLVESFIDQSAMVENVGAQKTGAVWEMCDAIEKLPKGNRASMRRDLLTWTVECNDTMREFTELIQEGPFEREDEEGEDHDSFDGDSEQYTSSELPIASACVALLKCSRGTISVSIKACEAGGEQCNGEEQSSTLKWINSLFNMARIVGQGVTELGYLLYPPLQLEDGGDLQKALTVQRDAIVAFHRCCLDATLDLPEEVTTMANKLLTASQARYEEAQEGIAAARDR